MVSGKANSSSPGSDSRKDSGQTGRGSRRRKPPLDTASLRDLALSYAARFATTGARLEAYLARKIKERGVAEDSACRAAALDVPALVTRLVELGYVDDAAYARMRARDLGARGFGGRRIEQALWAAGVDEAIRQDQAPGEADSRRAAALMAQKRRIGPWGKPGAADDDPVSRRKAHEKAVAAMLRAGHDYAHVKFILAADGIAAVEQWLDEAADQDKAEREW